MQWEAYLIKLFKIAALNLQLLVAVQDNIKPIGLVFLGKIGDLIYNSGIITLSYIFVTLLISLLFPLIATSSLISPDGLNYIFIGYSIFLNLIFFEILYLNKSVQSFYRLIKAYYNFKNAIITSFFNDIFSIKLLSLITISIATYSIIDLHFISNIIVLIYYTLIYLSGSIIISFLRFYYYLLLNHRTSHNIIIGNTLFIVILITSKHLLKLSICLTDILNSF